MPASGDIKLVVLGAPTYFERHPKPRHPRELVDHKHQLAFHPEAAPYRWEFTDGGRDSAVTVPTRVLLIRPARAGVGLTMLYETQVIDETARGELVPVLEKFSTSFRGFYLYHLERRHASPARRAFVDYLRREHRGRRARSSVWRARGPQR